MKAKITAAVAAMQLCAAHPVGAQTTAAPQASAPSASSSGYHPKWEPIFENNQYTMYIDLNHIEHGTDLPPHNNTIDTMALMQYNVPEVVNGYQFSSVAYLAVFDCIAESTKTISSLFYTSDMGAGKVIYAPQSDDVWHTPAPGSLDEMLWRSACGKK